MLHWILRQLKSIYILVYYTVYHYFSDLALKQREWCGIGKKLGFGKEPNPNSSESSHSHRNAMTMTIAQISLKILEYGFQ
jgi:hypothetical protein